MGTLDGKENLCIISTTQVTPGGSKVSTHGDSPTKSSFTNSRQAPYHTASHTTNSRNDYCQPARPSVVDRTSPPVSSPSIPPPRPLESSGPARTAAAPQPILSASDLKELCDGLSPSDLELDEEAIASQPTLPPPPTVLPAAVTPAPNATNLRGSPPHGNGHPVNRPNGPFQPTPPRNSPPATPVKPAVSPPRVQQPPRHPAPYVPHAAVPAPAPAPTPPPPADNVASPAPTSLFPSDGANPLPWRLSWYLFGSSFRRFVNRP